MAAIKLKACIEAVFQDGDVWEEREVEFYLSDQGDITFELGTDFAFFLSPSQLFEVLTLLGVTPINEDTATTNGSPPPDERPDSLLSDRSGAGKPSRQDG